ncbi:MAG: YdcF family protein [Myxococcota bacterium]|nr:YdcF family protein [Myxococcota bacterium]
MRADAVLILGKELRRHPVRARAELRARAAAASVALRQGAGFVANFEARLRGQERSGSELVRGMLLELGVPAEDMHLTQQSRSTREEAVLARDLVRDHGVERLLVLTAAYHLPRVRAYLGQTLPYGGWSVQAPEALLQHANDTERAWILEGIPDAQAWEQERWVERSFGVGAKALGVLPGRLGEDLEIGLGALFRRVGDR